MNLQTILDSLIHPFRSEHDLIAAIEELSTKFTQNRERIGDYLKDPRLVSAYTAFYLTTNVPKLEAVLKWLPQDFLDLIKTCEFVDLGAGPGTFSLAWHEWGGTGATYQIETSGLMREQAKKLWETMAQKPLVQMERWVAQKESSKVLLFGHSANEMGSKVSLDYIQKIAPDHIIFIEPGTKAYFPQMLDIRTQLLSSGYKVIFPCPLELECPMRHSSEDWCHQFIQVNHSPELERITQIAKRDRKLLPLIVHVYSKTYSTQNPHERIVRVLPETKFSHEWEVCHDNELEHAQVMKRNLSKSEDKLLTSILAGSSLESRVEKVLEQSKRIVPLTINNKPFKP
jgi:hypothetical protein